MAAILSQYSTTGFYKAPVSKSLLGCMFLTCTAINVPLLAHLRKYMICHVHDIFIRYQVWRLFTCKTAFVDTKDLVCGALLVYYFRVFERRYGSRKFASYLLATSTVSTVLELCIFYLLQRVGVNVHRSGYIPPGPYGLIFPLYVNYFFDIPRVTQTHILGVPVTGKTLTYLLGLQICSTNSSTFISAVCGVVSGLMYRHNVGYIRRWLVVPNWLSEVASATLGRLLRSSPPNDGGIPMGATMEIQRQQQMEMLERQLMMTREQEIRQRIPRRNDFFDSIFHRRNQNIAENLINRERPQMSNGVAPPQEEQVGFLIDMGFDRQSVLNALRTSNNDLEVATNILLNEG